MKTHSNFVLEFAGAMLPVVVDEAGQDMVPLKPICEAVGIKWEEQRRKFGLKSDTCTPDDRGAGSGNDGYYARRMGVAIRGIPYAGQMREMVCIRLDRVVAFLNSINPENVRGAGNQKAADFLEEKHAEWDAVLHDYELKKGGLLERASGAEKSRSVNMRLYLSVLREKRVTDHKPDRLVLEAVSRDLAKDLGIPYQSDLLDSTG
ncbi:MAG: hypothetical protein ABIK08_11295 [Pseudomonadota bacterium]